MVNVNLPKTSNLDNMTNKVPAQDSNIANKNQKHEKSVLINSNWKKIGVFWYWNTHKNYFWCNILIRDTAPIGDQEQKYSIKEENITPLIHCNCNHWWNIGFLWVRYRCSCFQCLKGGNYKKKHSPFGIKPIIKLLKDKVNKISLLLKNYSERYGYWWIWGSKWCYCVI